MVHLAVWALGALVLASAVLVVTLRNLFRAALSLGLVLVGVAGLFLVLEAEFLAFAQILIYVGAILTLVVFAVMLTSRATLAPQAAVSRQQGPAAVVSTSLFIVLLLATQAWVPSPSPAHEAVSLRQLGEELITRLVLPFEVISLVFVAAMVGAIVVASSASRSSPTSPRRLPEG